MQADVFCFRFTEVTSNVFKVGQVPSMRPKEIQLLMPSQNPWLYGICAKQFKSN